MFVFAKVVVQVAHAHGEVLSRELVDHVGRDGRSLALRDSEGAVGRDARKETVSEVAEDGQDAVVLVQPRQRFRRALRTISNSTTPSYSLLTSSACSSRSWNSWSTMLACSVAGTYALPMRRRTLRELTRSGTLVQFTCTSRHSTGLPKRTAHLVERRERPAFRPRKLRVHDQQLRLEGLQLRGRRLEVDMSVALVEHAANAPAPMRTSCFPRTAQVRSGPPLRSVCGTASSRS